MKTNVLTTYQVADKLSIARSSVYTLFKQGLPHIKLGGRTFVREADIEKLIQKNLKNKPPSKNSLLTQG